ncbi:hypothetical protein [Paractinoplanes toevensis]|uniref:Uncharacterized protein n=1 Tax=Paractinoplanes toevensis TaxID=571911 RepID=A0A919WAQ0_9ACTN|nr:hypothetical protein [Actinoplanes toevensis]GIM96754.1 hypothetical protein Ato02nite_085470 [Actinoplanes toevensis]
MLIILVFALAAFAGATFCVLDRPVAVNKQLNRRLSTGLLGISAATVAVVLIYAAATVVSGGGPG